MMTIPGILKEYSDRILAVLDKPCVNQIILFGSRAKGTYSPGSDIDLALDAPTLSLKDLWQISDELEALDLPWRIDLVVLHLITTPELVEHIHRVGQVLEPSPTSA